MPLKDYDLGPMDEVEEWMGREDHESGCRYLKCSADSEQALKWAFGHSHLVPRTNLDQRRNFVIRLHRF